MLVGADKHNQNTLYTSIKQPKHKFNCEKIITVILLAVAFVGFKAIWKDKIRNKVKNSALRPILDSKVKECTNHS